MKIKLVKGYIEYEEGEEIAHVVVGDFKVPILSRGYKILGNIVHAKTYSGQDIEINLKKKEISFKKK